MLVHKKDYKYKTNLATGYKAYSINFVVASYKRVVLGYSASRCRYSSMYTCIIMAVGGTGKKQN